MAAPSADAAETAGQISTLNLDPGGDEAPRLPQVVSTSTEESLSQRAAGGASNYTNMTRQSGLRSFLHAGDGPYQP